MQPRTRYEGEFERRSWLSSGRPVTCLSLFQVAMNPTNTIFDAKRLIGRKFTDTTVQADMKHWPFNVVEIDGRPKIEVEYKSETKTFFAEEISSMVLTKMRETAEAYLGHEVKDAVVTVPAVS